MNNQRFQYIDVAKGLLIILVVFHHIPIVIERLGVEDDVFSCFHNNEFVYTPFFMAAFFSITGFISGSKHYHQRGVRETILRSLKGIILPGFTLGIINQLIMAIFYGGVMVDYLRIPFSAIKQLLLYGGNYWFLSAMFLSRVIDSFILNTLNIRRSLLRTSIYLLLLFLGVILTTKKIPNIWHFQQAFIFIFFIEFGRLFSQMKHKKKLIYGSCLCYLLIICLLKVYSGSIPVVTARISLKTYEVPVFLILSTCGSLMVIGVSYLIKQNKVLEFLGRNTIIIYGLHISFLFLYATLIAPTLGHNGYMSLLGMLLLLITVLVTMFFFIKVLNIRFIRFLIGKF